MPISPVARQFLFRAYQELIKVGHFEKQFNDVYFDFNQTQKGFYIEKLLITLISLGILKEVNIHTISLGEKIEESQKTKLGFKNYAVINFGGYFAPPKQPDDCQFGRNLLFVPKEYNYPGFDFFTYSSNDKTALFHQVAIMMNCHEHVDRNDKKVQGYQYQKAGTLTRAMEVISIDFCAPSTIIY